MTEPTPKPGAFDWMVSAPVVSEFHVPLPKPTPGVEQTLRVVITAKATVTPSRGWGTFIALAVAAIASLLLLIAINTAHGAEPSRWDGWESRQAGQDWGALQPGRTTTYAPWQGPGGQRGRCAIYQWRQETTATCTD